jgi:hypothetical protein
MRPQRGQLLGAGLSVGECGEKRLQPLALGARLDPATRSRNERRPSERQGLTLVYLQPLHAPRTSPDQQLLRASSGRVGSQARVLAEDEEKKSLRSLDSLSHSAHCDHAAADAGG